MRILIIGAGYVGRILAKELAVRGNEVIVVDKDPKKCDIIAKEADVLAIARDATDPSLYEEIDLRKIDAVIAVTDRDEVNMFVSLLAKIYAVPYRIARVRDERVASLMESDGIAQPVNEASTVAKLIQGLLEGKFASTFLVPVFSGNYVLISLTISELDKSNARSINDIDYPKDYAKVIAVFDGKNVLDPDEVTVLKAGYEVIALVRRDKVEEFISAFR